MKSLEEKKSTLWQNKFIIKRELSDQVKKSEQFNFQSRGATIKRILIIVSIENLHSSLRINWELLKAKKKQSRIHRRLILIRISVRL